MATSHAASSTPAAQWARYYANAGWRSFPIWPGEKRPIYSGWQAGATTDSELIERYFSDPARNIALICGEKFDAWDIEVEHVAAFLEWASNRPDPFPEGPIASTGRGGLHFLTAPTGVDGTRRLHLNGTHIGELKSRGGFILVCPSVTEQMYRWTWLPDSLRVSPAPDWLRGLLERPETTPKARMWRSVSLSPATDILPLVRAVQGAGEHDRNGMLHWAANRAYDDGIPQKIALDELLPPFMAIAIPGESLGERNIEGRATIASAYSRE